VAPESRSCRERRATEHRVCVIYRHPSVHPSATYTRHTPHARSRTPAPEGRRREAEGADPDVCPGGPHLSGVYSFPRHGPGRPDHMHNTACSSPASRPARPPHSQYACINQHQAAGAWRIRFCAVSVHRSLEAFLPRALYSAPPASRPAPLSVSSHFFAFTDPASPHTASATRLPTPRQGRHRPGCQCGHHSCVGRRCMGRDLDSFTRRADACAATLIRMPQAASQAKSSQVKSSQDESSQRQDTLIRNAASSTFMAAAACLVARAAVLGLWLRASARPPMTTTAPMTSAGLHLPTSGGAAAAFSP